MKRKDKQKKKVCRVLFLLHSPSTIVPTAVAAAAFSERERERVGSKVAE